MGDSLQIARSWKDMAALYLAQHKFAKAREAAQKAVDEIAVNDKANAFDRIWARYVLGLALCSAKDCPAAVVLLRDAVKEAEATLPVTDFPVGMGQYLLGYACWKAGDMSEARDRMQEGIANMNAQLGWGHPTYLAALKHYAEFLRDDHQMEAANQVDRRIRQAEAVVDVHALEGRGAAVGFAGLR
jgi:tetratricopeptide (TPR) repeat protein